MSALVLQNNALWYIFEDFTASILLSACFLIYVIRNQFSNHPPTHDNKIANELSARMTEINGILTAEIEKNKTRDGSITAEIERLLTDVYKKLSAEVNTKIANELSARLSEVNSTFTAELVRNNNELNKKLTAEIAKINSRDAGYVSKAQNILSMINDIEEDCRNDFGKISLEFNSVRASIEALRNEMIQRYAIAQRLQVEFDQQSVSNESVVNSTNESETDSQGSLTNSYSSSSGSSGSSQKFANIISVIREQFTVIFDRVKGANDYSLDQMCAIVSADILSRLGMGVIGKDTIKGFYRGENLNSKNLEKIGAWIDNTHLHRY